MTGSPNFGPRRGGLRPYLIVLHYTAMKSCAAARRALCDPAREVSAHYLISETGETEQLVDEKMRAWHAGAGTWGGVDDINSRSIGIELANNGASPFAAKQMDALEALLPGIMARWDIRPEGVIGHSDMAPGRKIDPGIRFDWQRLARRGLSIWPAPDLANAPPPDPLRFASNLRRFGYGVMEDELLISTFRLRFCPRHDGPLDGVDMAVAADLAQRWPSVPR